MLPAATATVTFDHYVVNGYGVEGAYKITNNSSDVNGISFNTQVTNGIVTYPSCIDIIITMQYRTYTMTAGSATPFDITDDVYSVTGNSSFLASDGSSLVCTITTPLVKAITCHNVGSGIISFVYDQAGDRNLDFGDGSCDNQAVLKIGANITRNITLK